MESVHESVMMCRVSGMRQDVEKAAYNAIANSKAHCVPDQDDSNDRFTAYIPVGVDAI